MNVLLKNGKAFLNGSIRKADILIKEDKIVKIAEHIEPEENVQVIHADDKLVSPGFIDVHVHLRDPGLEYKETIKTGSKAAARGGFTTICAMPNTKPVPDNTEALKLIQKRIREEAVVHVLPYGAITEELTSERLTDIAALKKMNVFALSDDGVGVQSARVMLEAMKKAAENDLAIVAHCEDNSLIYGGVVHDGPFARKRRLPGIPSVCESVQIARDVLLAEAAGVHYHVCHVSTKESVRVIRDAKRAGIHVTAEVTPHHLILSDSDIPEIDTNYKMNPPLREQADREALIEGLLDGTIDVIATDHAPHASFEKAQPIGKAPFGIVGSETAFPLLYTHLVETGRLSLVTLLDKMTAKPAEIFELGAGRLREGAEADITVIDLQKEKAIDVNEFASKGKNTPFNGWTCKGWPELTMVGGRIVCEKGVTAG
ncbi:dihydroorotase [Sporolactobacillus putidus]|uniref:Dihydroorotase n=1 Tax=Sporolactobacillus putidus TaxID=492735 RepID=A0A917RY64_9BACL|nr:dihydroorotase [Sporolactobacillus putidus]GGL44577.1 dihydroorotase [Sporolactobacillus putidus]